MPLTTTLRGYHAEVRVTADGSTGLDRPSAAQCQHIRSVASSRLEAPIGRVDPVTLRQIRETLALLLDL